MGWHELASGPQEAADAAGWAAECPRYPKQRQPRNRSFSQRISTMQCQSFICFTAVWKAKDVWRSPFIRVSSVQLIIRFNNDACARARARLCTVAHMNVKPLSGAGIR